MLLFRYLKFILFLSIIFVLLYISLKFIDTIGHEIIYTIFFPFIFILVNYAFIKLILGYIKYYNDLLIVNKGQLIVIKSSLFFTDNIEFIDTNKITKLDTYCNGLVPNLLNFGNLVVEQQREQVRTFHFVSEPFKAIKILHDEKDRANKEWKQQK